MRKFLCAAVIAVALTAVPVFSSSLTGSQVTGTLFYPDLSTVFSGPLTATVGAGVEFPVNSLAFDGSVDVTDSQIIWTATQSVTYGPGAFNGFKLVFAGAPTITNVTVDGATTLPPVSFSTSGGNTVLLNLAGLAAIAGEKTILDVTTAVVPSTVPEPGTVVLLATGLVFAAFSRKRNFHS